MCGIYSIFGTRRAIGDVSRAETHAVQHRGPDQTREVVNEEKTGMMVFHRLAIVGLEEKSMQPMQRNKCLLTCNGEIYNYRELIEKFELANKYESACDVEIILHLSAVMSPFELLNTIDGVFAFVLWDMVTNTVLVARDPIGVRPLFYAMSTDENNDCTIAFASEPCALAKFGSLVQEFPAGSFATFRLNARGGYCVGWKVSPYWSPEATQAPRTLREDTVSMHISNHLVDAVERQLHADRPIGCLLSGGLDSSLIASLICNINSRESTDPTAATQKPVHSFSIGMPGSTDLKFARQVADFIGTKHHEVLVTEQQMLDAIPDVVKCIGTYDVTTIRASVGMYLLGQYISEKTDVRVIFSGEGADEVAQGYLYFHNQPTPFDGDRESKRLIKDLQFFDVTRADRTISHWGLELRVPFLDATFVQFYLSIPPHLRTPKYKGIEKFLLRKAFDYQIQHRDGTVGKLLPDEVLWRTKEAFSDGVSSQTRSWHHVVQEKAAQEVSAAELQSCATLYPHCTPKTLEALWMRKMFEQYYPNMWHLTPYFWLPKWSGDVTDPSARVLQVYSDLTKK